MATPMVSRKRGNEHFNSANPSCSPNYSHSVDYLIPSKKPKLSHIVPGLEISSPSSTTTEVKFPQYPELKAPFRREVHAPVKKFGAVSGGRNLSSRIDLVGVFGDFSVRKDKMGIFLSKWKKSKEAAVESFRYVNKDKNVIDIEQGAENEKDKIEISEDSSVEGVEILEFLNEGGSVSSDPSLQHQIMENGKMLENVNVPASFSLVSDLTRNDDTGKIDDTGKLLGSLGLGVGRPVYQVLHENQNRKYSNLNRIRIDINYYEAKRSALESLRVTKKPEAKQDVLQEAFLPLTEEEDEEVQRALPTNGTKVLVSHEPSSIDIGCLRPAAWLNDEVINLYLELLKEREIREPKKFLKCHFFNTFFYKKLIGGRNGYDYKSVRRWTTQKKLGYALIDCEKIFVPIHQEVHWCLAVINLKEEKFQYLDSLKGMDSRVLKSLARYFVDEVKDKNGKDIDTSSWEQEYVEDLPEQLNGSDCGVFMIKYIDFYSRGVGLQFTQEHMPYFRRRTAKEILRLKAD